MGVAVVMVEKRPSGAEKEPRRGDLSPDRGGRGRAAASNFIISALNRISKQIFGDFSSQISKIL